LEEKVKGKKECFLVRKDFIKKGLSEGLFQIWRVDVRTIHQRVQNVI
jgi:hypothetical protein